MAHALDLIEKDYERQIAAANARGDNDLAYDLSLGLKEYRELYQVPHYASWES